MSLIRLTDDELEKRYAWEECAPNAYQQPDMAVMSMIREIQQRRRAEKK